LTIGIIFLIVGWSFIIKSHAPADLDPLMLQAQGTNLIFIGAIFIMVWMFGVFFAGVVWRAISD